MTQNNYQSFKKQNNGFLQFNTPQKGQQNNNQVAAIKMTTPFGDREREFTSLPDTIHNIMLQLIDKNMLMLPPVRECDPTIPFPKVF